MNPTSRRKFITHTSMTAGGFLGLQKFVNLQSEELDEDANFQGYANEANIYGPLIKDPNRILDLPDGFSYDVLSKTGDPMTDGLRTPGAPDGMAAFEGSHGQIILVRNHELSDSQTFEGPYGIQNEKLPRSELNKFYDGGKGIRPQLGGTTTVVFDPQKKGVQKSFLSLAGTERNCAGGPTPWGSWISCEETVSLKDEYRECDHGYNFEVPATESMFLNKAEPIKAMGRFNHEAVAVDPLTGIVYQTEDREDGLITRYIPKDKNHLLSGGVLQALAVVDQQGCDTRNWADTGATKFPKNVPLAVKWITLENIHNPEDKLRHEAHQAGAAIFARGEGMWYGNNQIYFACTSGGASKSGHIFYYQPSPYEGTAQERDAPGHLILYVEPNNTKLIEYCDNLTVSKSGDVVFSEDGDKDQYIRGITSSGKIYTIARSNYHGKSEMCGVCFAPNHPILFVNIQRPGITLAIHGPWRHG